MLAFCAWTAFCSDTTVHSGSLGSSSAGSSESLLWAADIGELPSGTPASKMAPSFPAELSVNTVTAPTMGLSRRRLSWSSSCSGKLRTGQGETTGNSSHGVAALARSSLCDVQRVRPFFDDTDHVRFLSDISSLMDDTDELRLRNPSSLSSFLIAMAAGVLGGVGMVMVKLDSDWLHSGDTGSGVVLPLPPALWKLAPRPRRLALVVGVVEKRFFSLTSHRRWRRTMDSSVRSSSSCVRRLSRQ